MEQCLSAIGVEESLNAQFSNVRKEFSSGAIPKSVRGDLYKNRLTGKAEHRNYVASANNSCYRAIESPWGEIGVFLCNDNTNSCRCQFNAASTNAAQVLEVIGLGADFSDIGLITASLDISQGP
jgi:NADH:ubiquinone oxidoreductase subunit D